MTTPAHSESPEPRKCTQCGTLYAHLPLLIDGFDMIANFTTCDPCSAILERKEAQAERKAKAEAAWESTVEAEYRNTSTDHPDFPRSIFKQCLHWMRGEKVNGLDALPFLGLIGESGRCKTRVISQVVKHIIWRGEFVTWVNSAKFQWCCQNQFNDHSSKEASSLLKSYRTTRNLVFDDIGSLKATETVSDNLYSLLEYRTANRLPMMWTSNELLEEMLLGKILTEKQRARSMSRLGGFSNIIQL